MEEEVTNDVCLFFSEEAGSLRIRPGQRGKTGWIKGKAKWDALYNLKCGANVLRLLKELYNTWLGSTNRYRYGWGYGHQGDWLPLDTLALPQLWDIFTELREAGVVFIAWDGRRPVDLSAEPARLRIAARRKEKEGGLELLPELCFGDSPASTRPGVTLVFLGKPSTVLAEIEQTSASSQDIRLRPFAEPPRDELLRLFRNQETLRVGAEEREDFENQYLPRLQQLVPVESPDNSYQPPAPRPAVLNLEVTPVTGEKDELVRLHLRWSWNRGPLGRVDRDHESAVVAAVKDTGASVVDQTLPRERAVPFLAKTLPHLQELDHVHISMTDEVPEFRQATHAPQVTVGMSAGEQDWFDLQVEVTVGGEQVSFAALFTALSRNEEIFVLPSGTYFNLDTPELDQLRRIIEEAKTLNDTSVENLKVSRYQVDLWEELVETGIVDAQEHDWWEKIHSLAAASDQTDADSTFEVPESLNADLRDYQKIGYRWLETLRRNNLGGVLADDMGLGKTLQVITMISAAFEEDPDGAPFLVVAPTSVVGNWVREVEKFAPGLAAVAIEGTAKKRGRPLAEVIGGAQVVVTSYTLFRLEFEDYAALAWSAAIFDEAQMIKNHTSKAYKNARLLDVPVKIAVTGTPLENNLLELWSLVSLTSPGLLGGKTHFTEFYRSPVEKEKDTERLKLLQRRLRPFLLRRTKELVAADLPEKTENVMEVDLYPKHRRIYDRRLQRERQKVLGLVDDLNANRFEVFRSLTLLRQLALDCELAAEGTAPSAKLDTLAELLSSAAAEGHRVLVLSQFTRFLTKARDAAVEAGIDSLYLDGKTRGRQKLIDEFREGKAAVFFISLKAGGFGLNLTEADYVVLLDPWWNPATEAQAVDRAHRIGQTRQVMVYRLVARDTIESKVMELKKSKAALFDRVLEGGGTVEADGLGMDDIRALVE
ncbi:superfamily II DNA/RNA helicase, SNF2 family protein [Corynebacterium halotolerans YIM 70093 = DSM 44683]|uniref:Superfamily II DNA/RNA helicase, SNF2 family protein n=1 Tax=Corynebacterium halotolerans YIM 70093 = DSM 44683 TaxID=1121362 RepID=M1P1A0_9CORY|nr:superfamily II DNA/RNA helicase, SNF2 family protein [Corynebacterium halotolerans YIM 70093 = DSM 44683]